MASSPIKLHVSRCTSSLSMSDKWRSAPQLTRSVIGCAATAIIMQELARPLSGPCLHRCTQCDIPLQPLLAGRSSTSWKVFVQQHASSALSILSVVVNVILLSVFLTNMQTRLDNLQGRTDEMSRQMTGYSGAMVGIERDMSGVSTQIQVFQATIGSIQASFNQTEEIIDSMRQRAILDFAALEGDVTRAAELVSTLLNSTDKTLADFQADVTTITSTRDEFVQQIVPTFINTMRNLNLTTELAQVQSQLAFSVGRRTAQVSATGNWCNPSTTAPLNVWVQLVGAGGGGAGDGGTGGNTGGGGAAGACQVFRTLAPAECLAFVIGTGGTGGSRGHAGSPGGPSTLTGSCTAYGGAGGVWGSGSGGSGGYCACASLPAGMFIATNGQAGFGSFRSGGAGNAPPSSGGSSILGVGGGTDWNGLRMVALC